MNITRCRVEAGQTTANFPVRTPRWAGASSSELSCHCVPTRLTTRILGGGGKAAYSATAWLTSDRLRAYPFALRTGPTDDTSMTGVAKRLETHLKAAAAAHPLFQEPPTLLLQQYPPLPTQAVSYEFKLVLAPYTAFYSTNPNFFVSLGFDPSATDLTEQNRTVGGRGQALASAVVHGYFNPTGREATVTGETVLANETLGSMLVGENLPPLGNQVQLQVEFMDAYEVALSRPEASTSAEVAAVQFAALFQTLASRLNLKNSPVGVARTQKVVTLASAGLRGTTEKLEVLFNRQICEAFGLHHERPLTFDLETGTRYDLKGFGEREDPFENLYPVTLLFRGFGDPSSWIEGEGYYSLAGTMPDGKGRPLACDGAKMTTSSSNLSVEFRDYKMEPVAFRRNVEFHLVLKFQKDRQRQQQQQQQQQQPE